MQKLSIIIPAYNEKKTFSLLMQKVCEISLPNIEKEIILVESNSSDGTREDVLACKEIDGVHIILQDKAQGKGNAVRAGLAVATGDFILIQDADLEYDVSDYPKLLAPLLDDSADFVLGSRHSNVRRSWKIRQFKGNAWSKHLLNFGHILFTQLFNIVYGQNLKDPFTMFKVFRHSCIEGVVFSANKFDFDWELAGKLCRLGYAPLEVPVNYNARSFDEGKKIKFSDSISCTIACFKYRFEPLNQQGNAFSKNKALKK